MNNKKEIHVGYFPIMEISPIIKTNTMNKSKAAMKRAKWLSYCLEIGWSKEHLPELEKTWDTYYDEFGNKKQFINQNENQNKASKMQTIEDILSDWHNRENALILANQFHKDELLKSQNKQADLLIKIEKLEEDNKQLEAELLIKIEKMEELEEDNKQLKLLMKLMTN